MKDFRYGYLSVTIFSRQNSLVSNWFDNAYYGVIPGEPVRQGERTREPSCKLSLVENVRHVLQISGEPFSKGELACKLSLA
jgi:hypothetical protein